MSIDDFIRARLMDWLVAEGSRTESTMTIRNEPSGTTRTHVKLHPAALIVQDVAAGIRRVTWTHMPVITFGRIHCYECQNGPLDHYPCPTARAIAAIWREHPDFESEWA